MRTLRLPEAEARSSSSLDRDAHHGRGQSVAAESRARRHPRVRERRAQPAQTSPRLVAPSRVSSVNAGKPRTAWELRADHKPHVRVLAASLQGADARRASQPASNSAGGGRVGAPVAGRRPPRAAGATRRCGAAGLQCHLSRESPHAHKPARARTCTPWAARTRERARERWTRFSDGFCTQQQNSRTRDLPGLQS